MLLQCGHGTWLEVLQVNNCLLVTQYALLLLQRLLASCLVTLAHVVTWDVSWRDYCAMYVCRHAGQHHPGARPVAAP
jgi:hypothetical protein